MPLYHRYLKQIQVQWHRYLKQISMHCTCVKVSFRKSKLFSRIPLSSFFFSSFFLFIKCTLLVQSKSRSLFKKPLIENRKSFVWKSECSYNIIDRKWENDRVVNDRIEERQWSKITLTWNDKSSKFRNWKNNFGQKDKWFDQKVPLTLNKKRSNDRKG